MMRPGLVCDDPILAAKNRQCRGDYMGAKSYWREAIKRSSSKGERQFCEEQLQECLNRTGSQEEGRCELGKQKRL